MSAGILSGGGEVSHVSEKVLSFFFQYVVAHQAMRTSACSDNLVRNLFFSQTSSQSISQYVSQATFYFAIYCTIYFTTYLLLVAAIKGLTGLQRSPLHPLRDQCDIVADDVSAFERRETCEEHASGGPLPAWRSTTTRPAREAAGRRKPATGSSSSLPWTTAHKC